MAQPNENKTLNFVAKVWDEKAQEYKPIYIAPDATDEIQGDVKLSDDVDINLDAETGMTAATPAAVGKALQNITIKNGEAAVSAPGVLDEQGNLTITLSQLDGSTVTTGMLPLSVIPQGALERLIHVADEESRFLLTTDQVQNGDTVQQDDTQVMYIVVDDTQLNSSKGYVEYIAGTAVQAQRLFPGATIQTDLERDDPETFVGDTNITPGVMGLLPIEHGGTGSETADEAWTALGGGSVGKINLSYSDTKFLRGDGTWQTVTTEDTKVTQKSTREDEDFPILLKSQVNNATITDFVYHTPPTAITINPYTGTIKAPFFDGRVNRAHIADNATRWENPLSMILEGDLQSKSFHINGDMDLVKVSTTLALKAVTLNKLADEVETIYVGKNEPSDDHIKFWIQP